MSTRTKREKIPTNQIPPLRLAFALILLLGCFVFLPGISENPHLTWSFLGAAASLLVFLFFLRRQVLRARRELRYEFLPKPVHYVQLTMHSCIFAIGDGTGVRSTTRFH